MLLFVFASARESGLTSSHVKCFSSCHCISHSVFTIMEVLWDNRGVPIPSMYSKPHSVEYGVTVNSANDKSQPRLPGGEKDLNSDTGDKTIVGPAAGTLEL